MFLLHQAIEHSAERWPDNLALTSGDQTLTHAALNRRANRLAHAILQAAGDQNEPALLLMAPGLAQFAAIIAACKARKMYTILDGSRPLADLQAVTANCGAKLILTDAKYAELARNCAPEHALVIRVDQTEGMKNLSDENPGLDISPEDFISVNYTSGSTGQPRGLVRKHKNAAASLAWRDELVSVEGDRAAFLTASGFSMAYNDMFSTLAAGAAVFTFDFRANGARACADFLRRERITIASLLPSMLRHLAAVLTPGETLQDIRFLRIGGEALLRGDLERIQPHLPSSAVIFDTYGTTECGLVGLEGYRMDAPLPEAETLRVGHACQKMKVRVVDAQGNDVPAGEEGEIIASGPRVAFGYWGLPEQTRAKFFVDAETGHNAVRTGDVGRKLPDGRFEWLGRKDSMVKIRGQRVILADVEAAARRAPNVKEAAVVTRRDPSDDDRVVAYIAPEQPPLDIEKVNEFLMSRLPAQALPTAYVELVALPINRNSKTDLRNLPEPDWGKRGLAAPAAAPRDDVERKLVEIWRDVLRLRELGADDNLFALGAHSILAARALARVEQECGAKLPLSALVDAPTPARLAQRIRGQAGAPAPARRPIIPLKPSGSQPPIFFVHVLGGGVMNYLPMAQALEPDQPFFAFQAAGFDGECDPHTSIAQMAAHYVAALRQAQPQGPYRLGGHCFGGVVAFEMARQLEAAGQHVAELHLIDAHAPGKPPRSESLAHPLAFAKNLRLWWKANGMAYAAKRLGVAARRNAHRALGDGSLRLDDVLVAPEAVPDDMVHLLKAQISAHRQYRAAPIHAPINLYRVELQPLFRAHQKLNGWEKYTSGGVRLFLVKGDHRTVILDTACAGELARAMTQAHSPTN